MSQLQNNPTPLDLRTRLHEMVVNDLVGPAGGADEIVDEQSVRSRYIVGMLAPKGQSTLPDENDELSEQGGHEDPQEGKAEAASPGLPVMLPSSLGLTFTVSAEVESIQVTARWGQYTRARSQTLKNAAGEPKPIWQRAQVEGSNLLPLKPGKTLPWSPCAEHPDVYVRGLIRKYEGAWSVTLFLVNAQTEPRQSKDEAWVFQPELIVSASDGSPVFLKRPLKVKLENEEPETQTMRMTYRRQVEFAVGHGVGTTAEKLPGQWERAVKIHTITIPDYEVEQVDAPRPGEVPALDTVQLDMTALSQLHGQEFKTALDPLPDAYEAWINAQEARLNPPSLDLQEYTESARASLSSCRTTLRRIREGITQLVHDENAAAAFRFANRAMALQRIHSLFSREIRQSTRNDIVLENYDIPKNRSWRPFQLAFLLLNIPSLLDPTHADRIDPTQAKADLLWFPTGGGKTEAYLGVAAFTLAIRRLQGTVGGYSGHAGVAVLMRYTLRLLTLQQFQRATALICACEVIRREDETQWGAEPFRIGLWVGQKSTPNTTDDSAEALRQAHGMFNSAGSKGTPLQITNCPWCGRPISENNAKVEVYGRGRGRTFQFCSDPYGQCPFSERQSPNEGLPIVVVDEEIYRRLPSFLIATVDKFAQMPWKGETQALFGRVNGYCPRHGFRTPDLEDSDTHPAIKGLENKFPAVKTRDCQPLRPPDLIIQDELHLISGPLGTLVGLYETAVDRLCSWDYKGVRVRPKVIASTATIRRAQNQVHNLFLRDVQIFPPSGLDAGDNFFSRRRPAGPEAPGRLYLGICAPGTRMKTILIRIYVAYLAAAQTLFKEFGGLADPWMTLVGYFNSMRELGGMRRVTDDAVRTRLRQMDERGMARRFIEPTEIEELTSRKSAGDIPHILDRLETSFPAKRGEEKPYDVVLATNMISVGVDVSRLGLMVVASQPKATSEYIQATSRVGRAFPGIVCTVYNWARPRDLSHYERFEHYHATFYQQVEALSVTPFSPRALDRGLSGVYVSQVRLLSDQFNANNDAGKIGWPNIMIDAVEKEISRRAGLVAISDKTADLTLSMLKARRDEWLSRISAASGGAILNYKLRRTGQSLPLLKQPTEKGDGYFFCLNSLRDVEPQVRLIMDDRDMDAPPPDLPLVVSFSAAEDSDQESEEE